MRRQPGRYEQFVLSLRWVLVGFGAAVLLWRRPDWWSALLILLLVAYTAILQHTYRRPSYSDKTGYYVVAADLVLISALVFTQGGASSDLYNLYYLSIVQAAVLLGWRESVAASITGALLYALASVMGGPDWLPVILRGGFFVLIGALTGYLADAVKRERLEREASIQLLEELRVAHENLRAYAEEIGRLAVTDGLTKLYNHTYFQQRLDEEIKRAERYGFALSLLMIDIDHFKDYNDTHGHMAGNGLLKELAALLKAAVREVDIVARYGGEEFAIILPETDGPAALGVADRIRGQVEEHPFVGEAQLKAGRVTVSIGVAAFPAIAANRTELIERADQALYAAKRGGRNGAILYPEILPGRPGQRPMPAGEGRKGQPGK
ncbi:MAG TPA: GGDEF domain-containing protein [Bacillota bacterium]|jgi:diguanylate cyclase